MKRTRTWFQRDYIFENKRKAGARKAGAAPGTTAGVEPVPFPGLQTPKTVRGSFAQAFGLRALKPAFCIHGPFLLRRSSLPFACPQTRKMFRGSFDKALWPEAFGLRALKPAVCLHGPLLLGRSSLPFARPQTRKMFRGSFDKALWPQAFGLRALKPAICLHGPLLLRRSCLPFACPQTPQTIKMFRGSFDQALWPQAFGLRALKPAPRQLRSGSLATGILLLEPFSRPFASRARRCSDVQACCLPGFKPLKSPAAASTRHSGHSRLLLCVQACRSPTASAASAYFISFFPLPFCRERANVSSGIVFPTACHA